MRPGHLEAITLDELHPPDRSVVGVLTHLVPSPDGSEVEKEHPFSFRSSGYASGGRMVVMRGFSTHADLLVYPMDISLNTGLDGEMGRIHRWLLSRYGMLSVSGSVELDTRLFGRLNYLRRRLLSYQLIFLVEEGIIGS